MDDPNQDAYGGKIEVSQTDEYESTEISEGDSGNTESETVTGDAAPTPEPESQVSEIFQEDESVTKATAEARQKTRNGIIKRQVELLLTSDEDQHEEILNKYPIMRSEIETEYNDLIQPEDDRVGKLEKEIERLKQVNQKSEVQKSKEEFDNFLSRSGFTTDEFNKQYGKVFISSVKNHMATGEKRSQALTSAIGELVMSHGFVPKTSIEEAEERGRQSAGMVMPSGNARYVSPERSLQKELAEHNATLAEIGASPISLEVFKKYKKGF